LEPDAIVSDDELLSVEEILDTGRMRQELAIARLIQRGFLPKAPPNLHGFEIDGWNEPCRETGGDYYDYLRLPRGRLGLAVGDVSGHGIGAALLMASARAALRALLQVEDNPAEVLTRLNNVLVDDMLEDHFMTMFIGVVDLTTRRLRYSLAGHERPLLLRAGADTFDRLEVRSMPLGIVPDFQFAEGETRTVRKRDVLVALTDGIWEATNAAGEEYGYDRFRACVRRNRERAAAEIVAAVRDETNEFVGTAPQSDDLTLLALKVL